MTRKEEVAWAAGLFEGEGCVYLNRARYGSYPGLMLSMTDFDIVDEFARIVGCGTVSTRRQQVVNWKPLRTWQASNREAYAAVRALLLPYLGVRRSARFAEIEEEASSPQDRTRCIRGHERSGANLGQGGRCLPCRRERGN